MILDGGPCALGLEFDGARHRRRRRHAASPRRACRARRSRRCSGASSRRPKPGSHVDFAGQLATHYAPCTPLRLDARSARRGEALLAFGPRCAGVCRPHDQSQPARRSGRSRGEFLCRAAHARCQQASRPSRSCQFPPMASARRSTTGSSAPLRLRQFPSAPSSMTRERDHIKRPSEETLDALVAHRRRASRDPRSSRHGALSRGVARPLCRQGCARAEAWLDGRSCGDPEARQRDAHGDRAARRQYRSRRRADPVRERQRSRGELEPHDRMSATSISPATP